MDNINNNNILFGGELLHSVQIYWQIIASTLEDARNRFHFDLDNQFVEDLNSLIQIANNNVILYGELLRSQRGQNESHNYENNENLFYYGLSHLLNRNNHFTNTLQNIVREGIPLGVRYFVRFLQKLNL